jgi:hypothetical protein
MMLTRNLGHGNFNNEASKISLVFLREYPFELQFQEMNYRKKLQDG